MLSQEFINAIKTSGIKQYKLAQFAGAHPASLSHWISGIYTPKPCDKRILKLAEFLGFPFEKIFES